MTEATSLSNRFDHIFSSGFAARFSSERRSQRAFLTVCVLLFAVSAAVTVVSCMSMSAMGDMPMVGGWTMSMAWMRKPEETWLGHSALFVGMWVVMMIAMMLPSLVPVLWKYRRSVPWMCQKRLDYLTALLAIAYFSVWTIVGIAVFGVGAALAGFEMRMPTVASEVPVVASLLVLMAVYCSSRLGNHASWRVVASYWATTRQCQSTHTQHGERDCAWESIAAFAARV